MLALSFGVARPIPRSNGAGVGNRRFINIRQFLPLVVLGRSQQTSQEEVNISRAFRVFLTYP